MILPDFKDFPKVGRLRGIDWGARRMGVAVSTEDQNFVFAHPQLTVNNERLTINEIKKIIADEKIVGVVIGLPLRGDGSESDTTRMVRKFANELSDKIDLPIAFIDESLTSVEAMENNSRRRGNDDIDSESAKVILENAIAMINRG